MKKVTIFYLFFCILLLVGAFADNAINDLTEGRARQLFCLIDGSNCALGGNATSGNTTIIYNNTLYSFQNGTDITVNKLTVTSINQTSSAAINYFYGYSFYGGICAYDANWRATFVGDSQYGYTGRMKNTHSNGEAMYKVENFDNSASALYGVTNDGGYALAYIDASDAGGTGQVEARSNSALAPFSASIVRGGTSTDDSTGALVQNYGAYSSQSQLGVTDTTTYSVCTSWNSAFVDTDGDGTNDGWFSVCGSYCSLQVYGGIVVGCV